MNEIDTFIVLIVNDLAKQDIVRKELNYNSKSCKENLKTTSYLNKYPMLETHGGFLLTTNSIIKYLARS